MCLYGKIKNLKNQIPQILFSNDYFNFRKEKFTTLVI
jgi:hypothetical protein